MIVNFPIVEDVSIITADGREWFCPRRDIKTIHADHTYKAIRAKAKGEDGV
jgi:hypothetical protein